MKKNIDIFYEGLFYHIYNRTNNKELLFRNDSDRIFFLQRFVEYLSPFVDTYSYILLDNHFHFLIRVKTLERFIQVIDQKNDKSLDKAGKMFLEEKDINKFLSKQFSNFFTSYSMRFNNKWDRNGILFQRPFHRLEISNENHLTYLIYYIHRNLDKHKIRIPYYEYEWSSYKVITSKTETLIQRNEVLEFFGGTHPFIEFHKLENNWGELSTFNLEG